nr:hypothetical protein CFP56_72148 [Quercus suber]
MDPSTSTSNTLKPWNDARALSSGSTLALAIRGKELCFNHVHGGCYKPNVTVRQAYENRYGTISTQQHARLPQGSLMNVPASSRSSSNTKSSFLHVAAACKSVSMSDGSLDSKANGRPWYMSLLIAHPYSASGLEATNRDWAYSSIVVRTVSRLPVTAAWVPYVARPSSYGGRSSAPDTPPRGVSVNVVYGRDAVHDYCLLESYIPADDVMTKFRIDQSQEWLSLGTFGTYTCTFIRRLPKSVYPEYTANVFVLLRFRSLKSDFVVARALLYEKPALKLTCYASVNARSTRGVQRQQQADHTI